jgi:hypothetical protein
MSKQKLTNTELTTRQVYENLGTGLGEMHKGGRFEPVNDIPTLPCSSTAKQGYFDHMMFVCRFRASR